MIYYPLSVLMIAGTRQVLVISTPTDIEGFKQLLGDGGQFGISITYAIQPTPGGLAQAFLIGREFIGNDHVALILGDNLYFGQGFQEKLDRAVSREHGATIFTYGVKDPQRYGVAEFNQQGRVISLEEKPQRPRSNSAVTGLYFFDNQVVTIAENLKPSARGELEITDVNLDYWGRGQLYAEHFGRGFAWLDMGTEASLLEATNFVEVVQSRQGMRIACIEEVAYRKGFISAEQLDALATPLKSDYGKYLQDIVKQEIAITS
jgi:glucose-1-phosphate thymidylyltransferase